VGVSWQPDIGGYDPFVSDDGGDGVLVDLGSIWHGPGAIADDADWQHLPDYLAPSASERMQLDWIRQLNRMEEQGDRLDVARMVDHAADFGAPEAAAAAAQRLGAAGFTVLGSTAGVAGVQVRFQRVDAIDSLAPEFLDEICEIVGAHGGAYGGWQVPLVRADP
jgi:Regulator of ribonuclease activity B